MSIASMQRDLDTEAIWAGVQRTIGTVTAELAARRVEVRGLGLAAARHTLIVEDAAGRVLFASGNDDLRATLQGAAIDDVHGDELMRAAGHRPALIFWPGKLAWIDGEASEIATAAARVLTLDAWLVERLTGQSRLSPASSAETGAHSLRDRVWLTDHLPTWSLDALPEVVPDFETCRLRPESATRAGLPPGTPIAVGQPDSHAAELATRGAGLVSTDCVIAGWSVPVMRPIDDPFADASVWRSRRVGGGFLAESNAGDAATGYAWLKRFAPNGELTERADPEICAAEQGVFATGGLRAMDPAAPSLGVAAMLAPIPVADTTPSPALMGVAVLEDLGFAVRANRARLDAASPAPDTVRFTGGYASAPAAGPVLANVLGTEVVTTAGASASAWGAAIGAAIATGDLPADDAPQAMAPPARTFEPVAASARAFEDHFVRWLDLRRRLESFVQDVM